MAEDVDGRSNVEKALAVEEQRRVWRSASVCRQGVGGDGV